MKKKTVKPAIVQDSAQGNQVATAEPTVKPTAESMLPASSINILIKILMNADVRASAAHELDVQIQQRKNELEQLLIARKALEPCSSIEKTITPILTSTSVINDSSQTTEKINRTSAILNALKGEKNGLTLNQLYIKLNQMGYSMLIMNKKNLSYSVCIMAKNGKISKKGKRGNYNYKIQSST